MYIQKVNKVTWYSLVRPSWEDIKDLATQFPQINQLILDDIASPTIRPRVESFDKHLYIVLHFPNFVREEHITIAHEIDFILLPDAIITVQYRDNSVLDDFHHACENEDEAKNHYGKDPVHLLYFMLRALFTHSLRELDEIQEEIDAIEEKVFSGKQKEVVHDIANLKRTVLAFRRAIRPQEITLESLVVHGTEMYGEKSRSFFSNLGKEYIRVWNLLENHTEVLDSLYDTNNSLLGTNINATIRSFTILAFMTFIPTSIAAIFGMNVGNPFEHDPNGVYIIVSIMIITTLLIFLLLRWRKLF